MKSKLYLLLFVFTYFQASAYDFPKEFYFSHKYVEGEKLKDLAEAYSVSFAKLIELNNTIATSGVKAGNIIRIPIANLVSIVAIYNGQEYNLLSMDNFPNMDLNKEIKDSSDIVSALIRVSIENLNNSLINVTNNRNIDQITIFFKNDAKVEIYDPSQVKLLLTSLQRIHFLRNNSHMVFNRG